MRAALYRDMGEAAEVFRLEEVDRPEPGPGEVLVRVHASGVNPTDSKARSGAVPRPIDDFQIREPLCRTSLGLSTTEPWPGDLAGKRLYIFPDHGWQTDTPADLARRLP